MTTTAKTMTKRRVCLPFSSFDARALSMIQVWHYFGSAGDNEATYFEQLNSFAKYYKGIKNQEKNLLEWSITFGPKNDSFILVDIYIITLLLPKPFQNHSPPSAECLFLILMSTPSGIHRKWSIYGYTYRSIDCLFRNTFRCLEKSMLSHAVILAGNTVGQYSIPGCCCCDYVHSFSATR